MLLRSAVTPSLEAYMACGGRRVDAWLERLAVVEVLCSDEADTFVNVNDPDELRRVETRLLSTGGAG
jgi:molybdopterin-guanine dinucleotide biosynthesis protein A